MDLNTDSSRCSGSGVRVKVASVPRHGLPQYATPGSAGMDLKALLPEGPLSVAPLQRVLVPTGLRIELPEGWEAQIRPRSGLALKKGLTVANAPGTVDSDYRGEVGVILINLGAEPVEIEDGERIAQMVVAPVSRVEWVKAAALTESERGEGGFGHTGQKPEAENTNN